MKCECCKEKESEYRCERCEKEICLECCSDDYPYNTTICVDCVDEWQDIMNKNNFVC